MERSRPARRGEVRRLVAGPGVLALVVARGEALGGSLLTPVTISVAASQITLERDNTAEACDVGWLVVEFAPRRVVVIGSRERLEGAATAEGDREPEPVEAEGARAEDVLTVDRDPPPAPAAATCAVL